MRVLHHLWLSPFCRKVRLVLEEKRLEYEMVVEPVDETLGKFRAAMALRSEFKFATNGKLPPGTLPFSFENDDWVYHGYVFSTEMSALADKSRKGMLEKSIKERSEELKKSVVLKK